MAHALLSPSSASRWIACTPSARFEQQFPDSTSVFAEEGTLAHSLGELLIRNKLGEIKKASYKKLLEQIKSNELYEEAMFEYCDEYATFVMERFAEAQTRSKHAQIHLEIKLDLTKWVPNGYGTSDVIIVADDFMETIDLKYGKGVPVSVEENKQQMLYALGAIEAYEFLFDIHTVRMTVFQPRISNTASWETNITGLKLWAEDELITRANMAHNGEGEFVPGPHCGFCKGKAVCKALASFNLQLAKHEFADPNKLSDDDISDIMQKTKMFVNWIDAVNDYALDQAINHGKKWPGYKVVEGRSNRKYTDAEKIAEILLSKGFNADTIYNKKLLSITDMESELGKKIFTDLVGEYVIKPQGKPTLAPSTDKRPEINSLEKAQKEFL